MISKYTFNGIDWIDLQSPTTEEVASLVDQYSIPPMVAEEFITETVRSKVDLYNNLIYLVLHFPIDHMGKDGKTEQEIDFVVGKKFLITIHYQLVNPLHEFFKKFEVRALLNKEAKEDHAGYLFYHIIKELYRNVEKDLEVIHPELRKVEQGIFSGKEKETVKTISEVNRKLLNFKQAMRYHNEALKSFESAGKKFFEPEFAFQLEAIIGEYNKIKSAMDSHKETIVDLRETNDSLLSSKTNETMKILTMVTFMIAPASIIPLIFMMNSDFGVLRGPFDFYLVIAAMISTGLITFLFFKYKRWL